MAEILASETGAIDAAEVLHSQLQRVDSTPLGEAALARAEDDGSQATKPKPFAAQPVHDPERARGRRRKPVLFDQEHPQGTA
jgi:hypothetical protein